MFSKSIHVENERIIQALERIAELQEKILFQLQGGSYATNSPDGEWIESLKVQEILGISPRHTLPTASQQPYLTANRRPILLYYAFSNIFKLKDQYLK